MIQLRERTRGTYTLDCEVSVVAVTPASLSFLLLSPQMKASESCIETDESLSLILGKAANESKQPAKSRMWKFTHKHWMLDL